VAETVNARIRAQSRNMSGPIVLLVLAGVLMPLACAAMQRGGAGADAHGTERALAALYAGKDPTLLWSRGGHATPQALALLDELAAAASYGLNPADYGAAAIAPGSAGDSGSWERYDRRLSAAALRFVVDLHYGRIDPLRAGFHLEGKRPSLDLVNILQTLAAAPDVAAEIAAIEPQFYHYKLLEQSLHRYRQLAAQQSSLAPLPKIPRFPLRPGQRYVGAASLRALLMLLGDLPLHRPEADVGTTLDPALVAAVRHFQQRHGLAADGTIGRATFAALATPLSFRVRQIELTLERWRWLPPFENPPIIVNIPQFRLFAFRSTADLKADILQMDVIVGRTYPSTQTPVFAADMKYVIFRPYWDVPYSITRRELLPAIRRNPDYLTAQHLEIVQGDDDSARILPPTADNLAALEAGRLRLRQQPGADNALGLIKFMLPNANNVYLHSTPAHRLFNESRRTFSHGCIRVSDPVALAVHVLHDAPGDWTPGKVEAEMNGTVTRRVVLAKPIRVLILYATVLATEAGDVLFFDDIYGHDGRLAALLESASRLRPGLAARSGR